MASDGTSTHTDESPRQGETPINDLTKIKVHIGDKTFDCYPEPLKQNSAFFAKALAHNESEVLLPRAHVSSEAFCAIYGWLSKQPTPYATFSTLVDVPLAAEFLGIPSIDSFWDYQQNEQMRRIQQHSDSGPQ